MQPERIGSAVSVSTMLLHWLNLTPMISAAATAWFAEQS
jgi:hypothetical protein